MTTDQPPPAPGPAAASGQRVLRRRVDERVIGGVASGLGDFLNVDPLLVRIGFVGLMVFGGLGLFLYVGAWLLIPDETTNDSIVEQLLDRTGLTASRFLIGMLLVAGAVLFLLGLVDSGVAVVFGIALVVIVMGVSLFRQASAATTVRERPVRAADVPRAERRERRRVRRRARSPLAWYVLGAAFVAVGGLALLTNVTEAEVELGQYFGLALGTFGLGLVIGTWWGRARVLILLGILLLPFAAASAFVTAPLEGGIGDVAYRPANAAELQEEYRLLGGRMILDLTELSAADTPIEVSASVATGQLRVVLPEDATVDVVMRVGAGELGVVDAWQEGTALRDRHVREGSGPTFVLDLEGGVGSVWLDVRPSEGMDR